MRIKIKNVLYFTGIFLLGFLSVTAPWIIANSINANQPVFISSNGGINLLIGNHEGAPGKYVWPVPGFDTKGLTVLELDRQARLTALNYILEHPYLFLLRARKNSITSCSPGPMGQNGAQGKHPDRSGKVSKI